MATRRWFQIHLSTAIFLVLVAGILLGLNLKQSFDLDPQGLPYFAYPGWVNRGWPAVACQWQGGFFPTEAYKDKIGSPEWEESSRLDNVLFIPEGAVMIYSGSWVLQWGGLAVDIIVALIILAALAFVLEWRISRKAKIKGA